MNRHVFVMFLCVTIDIVCFRVLDVTAVDWNGQYAVKEKVPADSPGSLYISHFLLVLEQMCKKHWRYNWSYQVRIPVRHF